MNRQLKLAAIILGIVLVSLFLFSCSKKTKLTALSSGPTISDLRGTRRSITLIWQNISVNLILILLISTIKL